jgi:hypothetical protein
VGVGVGEGGVVEMPPNGDESRFSFGTACGICGFSVWNLQHDSFDSCLKNKLKSRGEEDLFEDISSEVDKEKKKLSADIRKMNADDSYSKLTVWLTI